MEDTFYLDDFGCLWYGPKTVNGKAKYYRHDGTYEDGSPYWVSEDRLPKNSERIETGRARAILRMFGTE